MDLGKAIQFLENSMIVGDPWLFELALYGAGQARMAQLLLRTQAQHAHRTGHIMDLGQEYVRRRIKGAARFDIVPRVIVRCLRCDTQAYLNDWVRGAIMARAERESTLRSAYLKADEAMYRFLEPCQGKRIALETDAAITAILGE